MRIDYLSDWRLFFKLWMTRTLGHMVLTWFILYMGVICQQNFPVYQGDFRFSFTLGCWATFSPLLIDLWKLKKGAPKLKVGLFMGIIAYMLFGIELTLHHAFLNGEDLLRTACCVVVLRAMVPIIRQYNGTEAPIHFIIPVLFGDVMVFIRCFKEKQRHNSQYRTKPEKLAFCSVKETSDE